MQPTNGFHKDHRVWQMVVDTCWRKSYVSLMWNLLLIVELCTLFICQGWWTTWICLEWECQTWEAWWGQREGVSFAHAHTLLFWMLVKQCVENEQATADDGHDATSNVSWMKMCRNFRWMGVDTTFVFHSWFCKKPLGPGFLDKTISFG